MADKTTGKLELWIAKLTDKISDTINTYLPENFTKIDMEFSSLKDEVEAGYVTVIDNLTSTSTTAALSANQGRALKELNDTKLDKASAITTAEINALFE